MCQTACQTSDTALLGTSMDTSPSQHHGDRWMTKCKPTTRQNSPQCGQLDEDSKGTVMERMGVAREGQSERPQDRKTTSGQTAEGTVPRGRPLPGLSGGSRAGAHWAQGRLEKQLVRV